MSQTRSLLLCRKLALAGAALIASSFLTSCGGGGAAGQPTIRPKTLDELVLILDGQFRFEFNRTVGTPAAIDSGDVETGTFLYVSPSPSEFEGVQNTYLDIIGITSTVTFPNKIQTVGYTYRAINKTSGVITLTGFDLDQTQIVTPPTPYAFGVDPVDPENVIDIDITFSTDGAIISVNNITLRPNTGIALSPGFIVPAEIQTSLGGPVPENYNPEIDPKRPSKIAPESLDGGFLSAFNGIPDTTKDFTIQFSKDITYFQLDPDTDPDEVGTGLLRVDGAVLDIALEYTWKRIGGTDNATLVLSNIPDDITLPFDDSLNGTYTLEFLGNDNGNYIGTVDGDTADAADVTGTFLYVP